MKIKDGYILKKVMGSYMVVPVGENVSNSRMQALNETAAFLWDMLSSGTDADTMCARLTEEYDIDTETAQKDIAAFVSKLKSANLLDE